MKQVAILGNASRTRDLAPFDNPDIEIWAMTIHALKAKRCDAVLEMHPDVLTGTRWEEYPDHRTYREWLQKTEIPIWMHLPDAAIPASQRYPRQEIEWKFSRTPEGGKHLKTFFGGTASYAVALAMYLEFERIDLYGIELNSRPAYDDERDCLFYWTGRAEGMGIDVTVHEESRLFRDILYPFERNA